MGNHFEMEMWDWLETCREKATVAYVAEVRSIVNDPNFCYADCIPTFYDWCMEHSGEKLT